MANASRAMAWPFHFGATGGVAYTEDPIQYAAQRIKQLVLTRIGERVMLPTYGTSTGEYIFEAADAVVAAELGLRIQTAITNWEPDIVVQSVVPSVSDWMEGELALEILFSVRPSTESFTTVVSMGGSIGASSSA